MIGLVYSSIVLLFELNIRLIIGKYIYCPPDKIGNDTHTDRIFKIIRRGILSAPLREGQMLLYLLLIIILILLCIYIDHILD